jgi:hypothetical protein
MSGEAAGVPIDSVSPDDEQMLLRHCLASTGYFTSGFTHRLSSPLGALLTNLSMLREDLAQVRETLGQGPGLPQTKVDIERALEDVGDALEIADRLRADLALAKTFAGAALEDSNSDLRGVLGHWSKTTAPAALGAGGLRVLPPESAPDFTGDANDPWLVRGSVPALTHLLTTSLLLIAAGNGWVRGDGQVLISTRLSSDRVEVMLSASCADFAFMTDDWQARVRALRRSALAQLGATNAGLELLRTENDLVANLLFQRAVPESSLGRSVA